MTIKEGEQTELHDSNMNEGGDKTDQSDTDQQKQSKLTQSATVPVELSEEDQRLNDELMTYLETLKSEDSSLYQTALKGLSDRLRDATSSMTSIPKPLKLLKPKLQDLKDIYDKLDKANDDSKKLCAEIVSVVGMTEGFKGVCLTYRVHSGNFDVAKWGHEYIKHLSAEMCMAAQDTEEFNEIFSEYGKDMAKLANVVVPYFLAHNAETDAVDLLGDFESLETLEDFVDEDNYQRVSLYLTSCADYISTDLEDLNYVAMAYRLYKRFNQLYKAMQCAIRCRNARDVMEVFCLAKSKSMRVQLTHLLAMNGWRKFPLEDEQELEPEVQDALQNSNLSDNFRWLARELDILEPKSPKDVYKTHLTDSQYSRHMISGTNREVLAIMDKQRKKIADAITNGIVNAGFGTDNLLSDAASASEFLTNLKDFAAFTTIATMGLIRMWDVDGCLLSLDPYTYSTDEHIKGGAMFGYGLSSSNVLGECDPVLAICSDCFTATSDGEPQKIPIQIGAVLGLGAAYAGTSRRDIIDVFLKCLEQSDDIELNALCVLCAGIVGVGDVADHQEVVTSLLNWTMSQKDKTQAEPLMILVAVGIALFYYRVRKKMFIEHVLDSLHVLSRRMADNLRVLVLSLSNAGTGDMLKLQEILSIGYTLNASFTSSTYTEQSGKGSRSTVAATAESAATSETPTTANTASAVESATPAQGATTDKTTTQKEASSASSSLAPSAIALSILGVGMVSMGDELSVDMAFRMLCQLLHIGHPESKKAVPLAIALLAMSNPKLNFMDTLIKFAHDSDSSVSLNSIIALGLIGAGTNNARISAMLRQLSVFHAKDSVSMMAIRISQGFIHLGKGTLSLNPFRTDRFILNPIAMAGLVSTLVVLLEPRTALSKYPYHLLLVMLAAFPRYLMTVDECTLKPISVSVRVGQAVDVVAQAGHPKTITGFQTHNTPVLLSHGERAELSAGDDEYVSLSPILEGVVLLQSKETEAKS